MKPLIDQANPQSWGDAQAGQIYAAQYKAAQNHLQYLIGATDRLTKEPEGLTMALETYFRVEDFSGSVVPLRRDSEVQESSIGGCAAASDARKFEHARAAEDLRA